MKLVINARINMNSCRICLESDGTFITPCNCKGTIKYVHSYCLNKWRTSNSSAYYKCDLCHYHYSLHRSMIATMLRKVYIKIILTVLCFIICSTVVGGVYCLVNPTDFPIYMQHRVPVFIQYILYGSFILGVIWNYSILLLLTKQIFSDLYNMKRISCRADRNLQLSSILVVVHGIYMINQELYQQITYIIDNYTDMEYIM
jgi:hypothetical protein